MTETSNTKNTNFITGRQVSELVFKTRGKEITKTYVTILGSLYVIEAIFVRH